MEAFCDCHLRYKVHADQLTSGDSSGHVQVFSEYALYLFLNVRFNVSGLL